MRGAPLDDDEVIFRLVKRVKWLDDDFSFLAYIQDPKEEFLSFARGEIPPSCQDQHEKDWPSKTYGSDEITAGEIRSVVSTIMKKECVSEDVSRTDKAIVDTPHPSDDKGLADEIGIKLQQKATVNNRNGCKDGIPWTPNRN